MILSSFQNYRIALSLLLLSIWFLTTAQIVNAAECPPNGTVYAESARIDTNGSGSFYVNYGGTQCRIATDGVAVMLDDGSVTADWVFAGGEFVTYSYTYNGITSYGATADALANSPAVRTRLNVRIKYANLDYCYPFDYDGVEISHHYDYGLNVSVQRTARCYSMETGEFTRIRTMSPFHVYPLGVVKEMPECSGYQTFNYETNSCDMPPPQVNESCEVGFEKIFEYIDGIPLNDININDCHFGLISIENSPDSYPDGCYRAIYHATGNSSTPSNYTYTEDDLCDYTPPKCVVEGYEFSAATDLCHREGYKPYHPTDMNHPKNGAGCSQGGDAEVWCNPELRKIEEPELDENGEPTEPPEEVEDELPPPKDDPPTPEDTKPEDGWTCEDGAGYIYCQDKDGNPLPIHQYPSGVDVDPDLCRNGYSGSNCDHPWQIGGPIPRDGTVGGGGSGSGSGSQIDLSGTNQRLESGFGSVTDKLDELFGDDGGVFAEPDVPDGVPGGDAETPTIDPLSDITGSSYVDDGLGFGDQCPPPKELVLFEGVTMFGSSMQKTFYLEYDAICQIGNTYRDFFIMAFVFFLLIDLIRRVL